MKDVVIDAECARRAARITQAELASQLGISQAHYSKVAGGVVPPSKALGERMRQWTEENTGSAMHAPSPTVDRQVRELSRSIQRQCRQLANLLASLERRPAAEGRSTRGRRGTRR